MSLTPEQRTLVKRALDVRARARVAATNGQVGLRRDGRCGVCDRVVAGGHYTPGCVGCRRREKRLAARYEKVRSPA